MIHINSTYLQLGATVGMVIMALLAIFIRMKASHRPINVKKIIMPPLGMSTGFLMFIVQEVRIPLLWGVISFLVGWFIFSYPLIRSTKFETVDGQVYVQRSRAFFFILLGLLAVRMLLHEVVQQYITIPQTASVFFTLAFGTLLHWRLYMYVQYRKLFPAGTPGAPVNP